MESVEATPEIIGRLRDFFSDELPDDEWLVRHTAIAFSDKYHQVTLTIDNINEEDYRQLKGDSVKTGHKKWTDSEFELAGELRRIEKYCLRQAAFGTDEAVLWAQAACYAHKAIAKAERGG